MPQHSGWTAAPAGLDEAVADSSPVEESEAYSVLLGLAQRRTRSIPPEWFARHVLSVTAEADWPARRAAMEALLRRLNFARHDELVVAARPAGRLRLGVYTTRRRRSPVRPYTTLLAGLQPLHASCDCADFLRGSLGLCKHLLTVIDDLASKPKRFAAALRTAPREAARGMLVWNPVRPFTGKGDWLERVSLLPDGVRPGSHWARTTRKWFRGGQNGVLVLKTAHADRPRSRLQLTEDLLGLVHTPGRQRAGARVAEPALLPLLEREVERLRRVSGHLKESAKLQRAIGHMKRKLYPYQLEGVKRFFETGRLVLADDMGLGKTMQAIAACHALFLTGNVRRGIVIGPASLKDQWQREWQLFSDTPITIVEGGPTERERIYKTTKKGFLIANYEQILRDLALIHAWQPDIIVLDEAQRIKNWATKTATYVKMLRSPYRLVLTGTPMENRLEELASILDWVDDLALEPKWRLVPWHSRYADGKTEVIGARNLNTLRERLEGCMLRRVRADVLKQLPPRTDTIVPVELTDEQAVAHAELQEPIARLVAKARKRPLTQAEFLRLMVLLTTQRIISNGLAQFDFPSVWPAIGHLPPKEALLKSLSSPTLLELREILTQLVVEQGRKVVVFSQWRRMLTLAHWAVAEILRTAGLRAAFFTGHEKQKQRTKNIVEFHDDPACCVLFATDAGGVGLNLQRAASCCVNVELPWNPAVLEQRIGRIYRLGQKKPIDVYNLMSKAGIEARIAGIVSGKQAFFTGLFDGTSNEVQFERSGSFLSRLETLIEPAQTPELPADVDAAEETEKIAEREQDELVAAADESNDPLSPLETEGTAPEAAVTGAALSAGEVQRLFSRLDVRPKEGGGLVIDAPPEAASGLIALFEGMASLLRRSQAD